MGPSSQTSAFETCRDGRTEECREVCRSRWSSLGLLMFPVAPDQGIRGTIVVKHGLYLAFNFGEHALGEHLAKLHPPLVEWIDLPDYALRKDGMLVERDELAEHFRRHL